MSVILTYPDGSTKSVENQDIPAEVARGANPPAEISVNVPAPDGTVKTAVIPYSDAARTTLVPTDDSVLRSEAHLADLEDDTSFLGSALRGAGEELSFGLYSPSDDQRLADETYSPWARGLGRIGGALAPALIPGVGEGVIARGIGGGARAAEGLSGASRVARGAVELLPGRAMAQVGAGVAERLGGKALGNIVGGAVENAGTATLRAMLDSNVDLSGETILGEGLLGGVAGGLGYGLARGAESVTDRLDNIRGKAARAAQIDDTALVRRLEQNLDPTPNQLGRSVEEHASALKGGLSEDVTLAGANGRLVDDARSLDRQTRSWRDDPFAPKLSKADSEALDRGLESSRLVGNYAKQSPEVQVQVMGSYGQHLQNLDSMADVLRRNGFPTADLPNRFVPTNVAARQEALAKLAPDGSLAERAAAALATRLTAGTEAAAKVGQVSDSLLSRIPVIGRTLGKVSNDGAGGLLKLGLIDSIVGDGLGGLIGAGTAALGGAKILKAAYQVPGRGLALASQVGRLVSQMGIDDPNDTQRVIEAIRGTTPDQASRSAIESAAPYARYSQDAVIATGAAAARRQDALARRVDEIFPNKGPIRSLVPPRFSSNQKKELERSLQIAASPTRWARIWLSGKMSPAEMRLAARIWPSHVERAKAVAIDWLSSRDPETKMPRSVRSRLELLLGADAVGDRETSSALAAQASIAESNARAQKSLSSGPPPGVSPGGPPPRDLMDPATAVGSRPTD